jgi:hypothetical protein
MFPEDEFPICRVSFVKWMQLGVRAVYRKSIFLLKMIFDKLVLNPIQHLPKRLPEFLEQHTTADWTI